MQLLAHHVLHSPQDCGMGGELLQLAAVVVSAEKNNTSA
jgi:hypothetical protein